MHDTLTQPRNLPETAAFAGITAACLRSWMLRFGYPRPQRDRHGHWQFSERQAVELRDLARRHHEGAHMRDLIVDGMPRLAPTPKAMPAFRLDITAIPDPASAEAQQIRRALILGLIHQHAGRVRHALAVCARLHPRDRGHAALLIIDAARRQNPAYRAWIDQAVED